MLGYNIIRGYPLAFGHDPGFTLPIFKADYKSEIQTADCRYAVPKGLVVIPDISCVTSFSSTTVQTSYELSKSLAVSANVQGGGWGVKFKASAGYKEASSTVSSGEFVYIISSAHCNYYFAKLTIYNPPELTSDFLDWVKKLDKSNEIEMYFKFFDYYGTHFLTETSFGASYTFENRMSSTSYQTQLQKGVNVAASASYSGLYSVSGGFTLDTDQRSAAAEFRKEVTTKTVTVGAAPPANGDAMTWASSVKDSPVPVKYSLSSIDKLFTLTYMPQLNANLTRLTENIQMYLQEYCGHLQTMGFVDSCHDDSNGLVIGSTKLSHHTTAVKTSLLQKCLENCAEDSKCVAVSFCKECTKQDLNFGTCFMFNEEQTGITGDNEDSWESTLMRAKISNKLILNDTSVNGNNRGGDKTRAQSEETCQTRCKKDVHCVGYSYCNCPEKSENCKLYAADRINHLFRETGTTTIFVQPSSVN